MHLVTVNDYLARRDALWMKPIYDLLGVTVGILQSSRTTSTSRRPTARRRLRHQLGVRLRLPARQPRRRRRGTRPSAGTASIVDEVDNILIDEARTPLIISGQPEQAADTYYKFAKLAKIMEPGKKPETLEAKSKEWEADYDFEPDEKHKTVS